MKNVWWLDNDLPVRMYIKYCIVFVCGISLLQNNMLQKFNIIVLVSNNHKTLQFMFVKNKMYSLFNIIVLFVVKNSDK